MRFSISSTPRCRNTRSCATRSRTCSGSAQEIGSTIEVITDEGDEQKRTLELDWLLKIDNAEPRRQIVKCQVERQGKKWKITALDPVEFFKD